MTFWESVPGMDLVARRAVGRQRAQKKKGVAALGGTLALLAAVVAQGHALHVGKQRSLRLPVRPGRRVSRAMAMRLNPAKFEGSELTITEYPMPVLRERCRDVEDFDDAFRQTCKEMMSIMYQADGVGLAATQVGIARRFFVYNPSGNPALKVYEQVVVNPRITEYGPRCADEDEGCLSSRSDCCAGKVRRSEEIWVEFVDERNRKKKTKLRGFEARVFQHEYDHVEGVLHIDRLSADDRASIQPELDKLVEAYGPGGALLLAPDVAAALQPPVRSGRMPAMPPKDAPKRAKKKAAAAPAKAGFGGAAQRKKKGR